MWVDYKLINHGALAGVTSDQPILPNLRNITISIDKKVRSEDWTLFSELFLYPTLVEIQFRSDCMLQRYLDFDYSPPVAQRFFDICASLQVLEFHPSRDEFTNNKWSSLTCSPNAVVPRILNGFSALRSFNAATVILSSAVIEVLGNLPLLETLGIFDYRPLNDTPPTLYKHLKMHDSWFPVLRNLEIYNLHPQDISTVWNYLPLVQNLLSVMIMCSPSTLDNSGGSEEEDGNDVGSGDGRPSGQEWVDGFIRNLPRASPRIEELELDFEYYESYPQPYSLSNTRRYLQQLPLRKLQYNERILDPEEIVDC